MPAKTSDLLVELTTEVARLSTTVNERFDAFQLRILSLEDSRRWALRLFGAGLAGVFFGFLQAR